MEKRFGALRFVATVLKILAWIFLIGGIVLGVIMMILGLAGGLVGSGQGSSPLGGALGLVGGFLGGLITVVSALLAFLSFLASAEYIHLQLAIEENTRETAYYLKGGDFQRR